MEFSQVNRMPNLIDSEGPILELVENIDEELAEGRLYLKSNCLNGKCLIYTKINDTALEMFFQGRLSVKELFLLRKDEDFIMEMEGRQELVFCDEVFEKNVIDTIECGSSHYYSLPQSMRLDEPFREVLHIVKRDYMNGIGAINNDRIRGHQWFDENND
ncbi:MAG: hypothetical protein ACOYMF_05180 [Bacteroidales bacterium]